MTPLEPLVVPRSCRPRAPGCVPLKVNQGRRRRSRPRAPGRRRSRPRALAAVEVVRGPLAAVEVVRGPLAAVEVA